MWKSNVVLVSLLVSSTACAGDDGSDSEGDDAADSEAGSTGTEDPSSTGSDSGSTDLLPGTEGSSGEDPSDTAIDATLSDGSSSSGGDATDCAALDPTACEEAPECAPITASAIVEDPQDPEAWCVDASAVVGCRGAEDRCNALLTHACDAEDNVYEIGTDCIPRGWSTCEPPVLGAPDCPAQDKVQ